MEINNPENKSICVDCVGDSDLVDQYKSATLMVDCSYCHDEKMGWPMPQFAQLVGPVLKEYCAAGETLLVANPFSDNADHEQDGDSLNYLLQMELEIETEPADDLEVLLGHQEEGRPQDGAESIFWDDQNLVRRQIGGNEHHDLWQDFSRKTKGPFRIFGRKAGKLLGRIFGVEGLQGFDELPVLEIGPDSPIDVVFRGRTFLDEKSAAQAKQNPGLELGPPPAQRARSGRMNPKGKPVFYGSLSLNTAVAEVRPPVGGLVVVGEFRILRRLKILDLSSLGIRFTGSLFSPEYRRRASLQKFLADFHREIAKAIQPHHAHLEYRPTQAFSKFVAQELCLDRILFASAQVGATPEECHPEELAGARNSEYEYSDEHNLVLFGEAGKVSIPKVNNGALQINGESVQARLITALSVEHKSAYIYGPEGRVF